MTVDRSCWLVLLLVMAASPAGAAQKNKKPASYTIPLPARPDFSALDWMIGEWAGHPTDPKTGKEREGTLHLTLSYALDKRFVRIGEEVELPAGDSYPAVHEAWSGFIGASASGQGFTMRAFSSTGFITQYHVTANASQLRFDPEGGANPPPGWLFRRTISRIGPEYFEEAVEAAPPGGTFFSYYSGKLTAVLKAPSPASSSTPPPAAKP
jgi:hypothetical protein